MLYVCVLRYGVGTRFLQGVPDVLVAGSLDSQCPMSNGPVHSGLLRSVDCLFLIVLDPPSVVDVEGSGMGRERRGDEDRSVVESSLGEEPSRVLVIRTRDHVLRRSHPVPDWVFGTLGVTSTSVLPVTSCFEVLSGIKF